MTCGNCPPCMERLAALLTTPARDVVAFDFRPPTKAFNLKLSFNKSRASREEVIEALEAILRDLRKGKG